MNRSARRPHASLLLLAFALLAVVVLETAGGAGSRSSVSRTGPSPEPVPGAWVSPEIDAVARTGAAPLTAGRGGSGVASGTRAAAPPASATAGADERPVPVRDGWTGTAVDAWERRGDPVPMAQVGGTTIMVPIQDPVAIGFHEASTSAGIEMRPLGPPMINDNRTRFTPPFEVDLAAHPYLVLASRGRSAGPTTAVDVVARVDQPVVAPVTGRVIDVRAYALYGKHPDHRIEIRPRGDAATRVVMVHVRDVTVEVGDRVIAGRTTVAEGATLFPFSSQIDRHTEPDRFPHVHLEVQAFEAPRPGDDA